MDLIVFTKKLFSLILKPKALLNSMKYHTYLKYKPINWQERAQKMGRLAVLDSRHSDKEFAAVTDFQKQKLYPLLKQLLLPSDKIVLDFGCGVGRFTSDLATLVEGRSVGVDVSQELLNLCSESQNVKYSLISDVSSLPHTQFDVIFCCLVLGGIGNNKLAETVSLLEALLSSNGLIFLVESTDVKYRRGNWRVRTVPFYQKLISNCELDLIGSYVDAGQEISIMAGRRSHV
jgi:cyclopropane fatty-acyl-phospholipid synthase-like methyltransferase